MYEKMTHLVTIDGPAGVGKSSVARILAQQLHFIYLDTGAMYRAIAYLFSLQQKKSTSAVLDEAKAMANLCAKLSMELLPPLIGEEYGRVQVNGMVLEDELRTEEIGNLASRLSALPVVRTSLTNMQRQMGKKGGLVAEGRDTGTVVFPHATWKFFLDAQAEVRARRRVKQLQGQGKEVDEAALFSALMERDHNDRNRAIAPLQPAEDALVLDTTNLGMNEVVQLMLNYIQQRPK